MSIEVERRALLSPQSRTDMLSHMRSLGEVQEIARFMIDFSGQQGQGLARERTVALRIDNGAQHLIVKTGGLADEVRQEARLALMAGSSLETSLSCLAFLGYTKAAVSRRRMWEVCTADIAYSLRDILSFGGVRHDTLLEIEACNVAAGEEAQALARVSDAFSEHNLSPLNANSWEQWVARTYDEVDRQRFSYSSDNAQKLAAQLRQQELLDTRNSSA